MTNDQQHFNNGKEDSEADFKMEFLKRHNQLRKLHSSPDLRLSEELCFMAEEWAKKISTKGHISFAEISGIGENITAFPTGKTAREMVDYWYKENSKYEYETPGWQAGTNYFTQIVWKATEELGVGCVRMHRIKVPDNKQQKEESRDDYNEEKQQQIMVVVAFYRPAGNSNRSGQFSHNVSKPFSDIVNGE